MQGMRRRWGMCLAFAVAGVQVTSAGWFREIEVTSEAEAEGKQDITVRLRPDTTHHCDVIEFECVYRQEFPWEDARGKKYTKVHEPVSFIYRRADVKLVNDLDCYISFRVPVDRKDLEARYGNTVFNKQCPITISRVKITGKVNGQTLWTYVVPLPARLDAAALARQDQPEREEAAEEEPVGTGSVPPPASR